MINICYMVDAPYAGGAERYISLIACGLDRKRFHPSVIIKSGTNLENWAGKLKSSKIDVYETPMDLPYNPTGAPRIVEKLRSLCPHIVHINMPGPYDAQMGLLVPLARLSGAAKVIVTEHLPMVEKLWKRALLKRFSYLWVDRVITVCKANVPFLLQRQGVDAKSISVVHNALAREYGMMRTRQRDAVRKELDLGNDDVAVGIIGSLIKRKGHVLLIRALRQLPDLPWRLIIIGEGEERGIYEQELLEAGMKERAAFLGFIPAEDVERLLSGIDILAVPSLMEAFPYAILEAMACSLPVMASRIYGIPEVAVDGETSILVDPENMNGMSEALRQLISDRTLRLQLGSAGRRRFENRFTLDRHLHEMQSIYTQVLSLELPGEQ